MIIDKNPLLQSISVKGEISNFKAHTSGHMYMSLKDDGAVIRAVMFRFAAAKLKFKPENGQRVLASGRVSVFERDGQYQLYINSMQKDGAGDLYAAFEALKEKLKELGWFEQSIKKKIPRMPKKIGIITSPTGAALRDMLNILKRRYPICDIIIFPSLVQGEGAPAELAFAVEYLNKQALADVILIGRGGGSIEDLWAFNSERLASAIFHSKIPVISAVGHETDFTICDFVSDLRASTPSAAAELCTPDIADIYAYLLKSGADMTTYLKKRLEHYKSQYELLSKRGVLTNPQRMLSDKIMLADHYDKRLNSGFNALLNEKREQYIKLNSKLDALSPLSVLNRGYCIATNSMGEIVKRLDDCSIGDNISIALSDGDIGANVKEKTRRA